MVLQCDTLPSGTDCCILGGCLNVTRNWEVIPNNTRNRPTQTVSLHLDKAEILNKPVTCNRISDGLLECKTFIILRTCSEIVKRDIYFGNVRSYGINSF